MKKAEYQVLGMHCVSCSMGIKKLLKRLKAVSEVDVELSRSKLFVTYDDHQLDNKTIIDTVNKLGYRAVLVE